MKTCPSCKHRFIPSFNARCPKCGHNLTQGTTCDAESGSPSSDSACDVIACRYCKLRLTLDEVKTWVGCDACNDGEDWLQAAIQNASSPNKKAEQHSGPGGPS